MTAMHHDVLDPKQRELLPLIISFAPQFYLVGGTALALQYGHRQSIDFDLFSDTAFDNQAVRNKVRRKYRIEQTIANHRGELTIVVGSVRCTWYTYPYRVPHPVVFVHELSMPDPLTIGAMKAFALGQRAKWKDYVDLYFIFHRHTLAEVVGKAKTMYQQEFEEKLFREQLAFHKDINYSEAVSFMQGYEVPNDTILKFLLEISVS